MDVRSSEQPFWKSGLVLYGAAAVVLGLLLVILVANTTVSTAPTAPTQPAVTRPGNDAPAIAETLRDGADLAACRDVIDQVNRWLADHPERQPPPVDPAPLKLLRVADNELPIAQSPSFLLLDAQYLELAILLNEAAGSLGVGDAPPAVRAQAAFDWVCRQVRLRDSAGDPIPPQLVLRRGWGSSVERSIVFCCLVEHLGLTGCLVECPILPAGGRRFWLAGAVADGQVYLFEPRLGVPLLTAAGDVATLGQLRRQPELVNQLDLGSKQSYDVTEEQAAGAVAQPAGFLQALAPRMKLLQELTASYRRLRLAEESQRLAKQFQPLAGGDLMLWNFTRILQAYYPPDQGGADQPGPKDLPRQRRYELTLIDGRAFPPLLAKVPQQSLTGQRIYDAFERPFLGFYLHPRSPRERMIRGQTDAALAGLVDTVERMRTLRERVRNEKDQEEAVRQWLMAAEQAEKNAVELYSNQAPPAEIEAAVAQFEKLWQASGPLQLLLAAAAGESLAGQADYLLALAKHEQAERAGDDPAAWQQAADRWQKHRDDYSETYPDARLLHARALVRLGKSDAARQLLENPPAGLDHWGRHAFLIRARRLKE